MISYPNVKVNLGLNVLRRRQDGFHDLETLFVPYFRIYDTLEITAGDDFSQTSSSLFARYGESGCPEDGGERNCRIAQAIREDGKLMITIARAEGVDWDPLSDLTAKAYGLLDADFNLPPIKIFLEKTSPVGAGLGGGSADCAFALKMISELFSLGLSDETLASYASRLGSDCAFFVYNRPMTGEGRGDILLPYDGLDYRVDGDEVYIAGHRLVVTVPSGIAVSTREAYGGIVPREKSETMLPSLAEALSLPLEQWKGMLVNDFETTVFAKHPELADIKEQLYRDGAVYASMSGSGSALFSLL